MVQDINGPGNKEVSLANFHIPKISRPFRAPLLEPGSLEPEVGAFRKEGVVERADIALATAASKNAHKNAKARLARQEENRNEIFFSLFICCCFIFCPMAAVQ
uniref:Uncharacterized protein n=1 Tax=Romanomermis culicivorax TaxID=13658 RepID=A0A915L5N6_ROMCU